MFEKNAEEYATKKVGNFKPIQEDKETEWVSCCEDFQKGAEFGYNKVREDADKMKSQFLELCNLKDMRIAELEKANEWHYVKDGDLPKDEKDVQVLYQDCDKINSYTCLYDIHSESWLYYNLDNMLLEPFDYKVIAWKEIVLPKESE